MPDDNDDLTKLANELGVEPDVLKLASEAAETIIAPVFLEKMAELGYGVEDDTAAAELLKLATLVRAARAEGLFVPENKPGADDVPVLSHAAQQLQTLLAAT